MKRQKREIKPKSHRRTGFVFRLLTMAAVALAAACCLTLFFQVEEIQVRGNHLYTTEAVAEASGISVGDHMVSIQKANAASLIRSTLPFVSRVHIARKLPGTVEITITEAEVTFAVRAQNQNWYLVSADGILLQEIEAFHASDYPNIRGVVLSNPQIGASVAGSSEQASLALSLAKLLTQYDLARGTEEINVTSTHDLLLHYGGKYDVQLGTSENLEYKIEYMAAALRKLEADGNEKDGILDLTFTEERTARFIPY